jgi:hypothetical protein
VAKKGSKMLTIVDDEGVDGMTKIMILAIKLWAASKIGKRF